MLASGSRSVFSDRQPLRAPATLPPTLMVVVDTEEEFDHSAPFGTDSSTTNVALLPMSQMVLERHGVVPTYVVDYPVAISSEARDVLLPWLKAGRCVIGAHLHPWVNPPQEGPVDEHDSYPGNLPFELEHQKLAYLTEAIADRLGVRPTIYKAGRYGVGPATADTLINLGYRIDISVVPYTDFSMRHGPDFNDFADTPFEISPGLLGLPLTVSFVGALAGSGQKLFPILNGRLGRAVRLPAFASRLGLLERLRLSPEGHLLNDLIRQTHAALACGQRLFMMTYHSSSMLPGANPYVRTQADRERFLATMDAYLRFFHEEVGGQSATVTDVADLIQGRQTVQSRTRLQAEPIG